MGTKKGMKLQEIQKLAERVQLKVKPEEADYLLDSLSELEKLLVEFRQLKSGGNQFSQPQAKLTLKNLHQLTRKFSIHATKQETILHNAIVSTKNFLIVGRKEK